MPFEISCIFHPTHAKSLSLCVISKPTVLNTEKDGFEHHWKTWVWTLLQLEKTGFERYELNVTLPATHPFYKVGLPNGKMENKHATLVIRFHDIYNRSGVIVIGSCFFFAGGLDCSTS
jgi:hypothetical protein